MSVTVTANQNFKLSDSLRNSVYLFVWLVFFTNAIVIKEKGVQRAYLKIAHAKVVSNIFRAIIPRSAVYLRAKMTAKVVCHDLGPQHDCSLGFFCNESDILKLQEIIDGSDILMEVL